MVQTFVLCLVFCCLFFLWVVTGSTPGLTTQAIKSNSVVHVLWFQGYIYLEKKMDPYLSLLCLLKHTKQDDAFGQ